MPQYIVKVDFKELLQKLIPNANNIEVSPIYGLDIVFTMSNELTSTQITDIGKKLPFAEVIKIG